MEKIIRANKKDKLEEDRHSEENNQRMRMVNNFLLNYFNWIIIIVVLIILAISYFMILKPKYDLVDKYIQLVELEQKLEFNEYELYLDNLNRLHESYDSITEGDKKKIDIILPKEIVIEELFPRLEALIKQQGFVLTSINISADELKSKEENSESEKNSKSKKTVVAEAEGKSVDNLEKIGKINLDLNILGTDYSALKRLLKTIENNLWLMDVNNLSWNPDGLSTNLKITTYFLK